MPLVERLRRLTHALLLILLLALPHEAGALSRAMWGEMNVLYLVNLRPLPECATYRARSLELLRDEKLGAIELDERMRALWKEAKVKCLNAPAGTVTTKATPSAPPPATVAAAPTPPAAAPVQAMAPPTGGAPMGTPPPAAKASPVNAESARAAEPPRSADQPPAVGGSPAAGPKGDQKKPPEPELKAAPPAPSDVRKVDKPADARPQPQAPPSGANESTHGPRLASGAIGGAEAKDHSESVVKPVAVARPQFKPLIERPSVVDLRLEAACAKRNPYVYQTASEDPCAKLAEKKIADGFHGEAAGEEGGMSSWAWSGIGLAAVLLGAGGWFGWTVWSRRRSAAAETETSSDDEEQLNAAPA